ncbi:TPA: hypothetical protein SMO99_000924 [Proteus mirabilis]|nr:MULTISPECIES: hypothetical protein [Proteus]AUU34707.1 hypothetical protein MC72_004730 [Proteus mirabilis]AWS54788.1 hypothetical protein AM356_08055 [Proteus mirabilis]EHZ8014943.1 hypothetical protein [Proteus mirabilis]EKU0762183.1 hypothetical protein [Proteus mirabilis]EKU5733124.1 hypothetical protein [Proteus mirabilis]
MRLLLDINWYPGQGRNHSWVAMDKNGYISMMLNNGYGWLPKCILEINNIKESLNDLCEYIDGDSEKYNNNVNKKGEYLIDLYSSWVYKKYKNKQEIINNFNFRLENKKNCDAELATKMGMFYFEALEGQSIGEDYPIGYEGKTKMGDYFRFIVPTVYATIADIPEELRKYIVVSDSLDFTKDRLLDNNKISDYFTHMYSE